MSTVRVEVSSGRMLIVCIGVGRGSDQGTQEN